jgi:ABC-2 type transport system ATP-binding protein
MNLLEIKNLKKYFATQKAVDDISFSIKKGSIFGLLGPNGAGKTTLIRMITGIFLPDSGEISFNGAPFKPLEDQCSIGYMPEERGLYKKMKIGEQLLYLIRLKGLSKSEAVKQIKYWFEKLNMESWWDKKVEDLSKGMAQKLQFVATVAHKPQLIILDEPFSGLDPVNANLIKEEIFQLAHHGATIIFSTHRMEQVEEICHQIILVHQGKKILDGTVNQIKHDFKENLFQIGVAENRTPVTSDLFEVVEQKDRNLLLRIQKDVTNNNVLEQLMDNGYSIESFQEVLPTLNDIFIRLVDEKNASRSFQTI